MHNDPNGIHCLDNGPHVIGIGIHGLDNGPQAIFHGLGIIYLMR